MQNILFKDVKNVLKASFQTKLGLNLVINTYRVSRNKIHQTLIPYNTIDKNVTYIIIYSKRFYSTYTCKVLAQNNEYTFEILLLNWWHPFFNLHRYWIIGNRPQPIPLLNIRYLKIYLSTYAHSSPLYYNESLTNIRTATFQQNYNNLKMYYFIYIPPFFLKV